VDRQRVDEVLSVRLVGLVLRPAVGDLDDVEVALLAREVLTGDARRLEVLVRELGVVEVLLGEVDQLDVVAEALLEVFQARDRLVPLDELRRADVALRVRRRGGDGAVEAAVRVGEDPTERRIGLVGVGDRGGLDRRAGGADQQAGQQPHQGEQGDRAWGEDTGHRGSWARDVASRGR
jgi:hypothetical protein